MATILVAFVLTVLCVTVQYGNGGSGNTIIFQNGTPSYTEEGVVLIEQFDPNTILSDPTFVFGFVTGFSYVSPEGVVSANGQTAFMTVQDGRFNLTSGGYFTGIMSMQIFVNEGNICAQNMAFALIPQYSFPLFTPPPGWYGIVPFTWGTLPANSATTATFSTPFSFFYNGTLPLPIEPVLVGALTGVFNTTFGNVTLSISLIRYNNIVGV